MGTDERPTAPVDADAYQTIGDRLPSSDALDGSSLACGASDISWELGMADGTVEWALDGVRGSDRYDAVEVRPSVYFIDVWLRSVDPSQSLTLLVDTDQGWFVMTHTHYDAAARTKFAQRFSVGRLADTDEAPAADLPSATTDLTGVALVSAYNDELVFKHEYLDDAIHWHCEKGDVPDSSDTDDASFMRVGPNQFLIGFREDEFECASVFYMDLEQSRCTGKYLSIYEGGFDNGGLGSKLTVLSSLGPARTEAGSRDKANSVSLSSSETTPTAEQGRSSMTREDEPQDLPVTVVYEELYFWHQSYLDYGPSIYQSYLHQLETPEPRRRTRDLLDVSGLLDKARRRRAEMVTKEDLLRVHGTAYVEQVESQNDTGGDAGEFTPFGSGGYDIARLAAGGVHAAMDDVMRGDARAAFALVRPPGHHAERDRGRGYCMFANIAVAVEKVRAQFGRLKVAVIDWDVHHGNGTQWIYYDDPRTLTISLHQDRLYPSESGMVEETGGPEAVGSNVNVPLPPGSGRGAYLHAWDEVVAPAVRAFAPDVLVIACGFDASAYDPNARMMLSSDAFGLLTTRAMSLAAECSNGRLVMAQEGGYSAFYAPLCGQAVVATLLGEAVPLADRMGADDDPYQELQPHQASMIERARASAIAAGAIPS